jgi:hypothetical protein
MQTLPEPEANLAGPNSAVINSGPIGPRIREAVLMRILPPDIHPNLAGIDILEAAVTQDSAWISAILADNDADQTLAAMATIMSCCIILLGDMPQDQRDSFFKVARDFFSDPAL